MLETSRDAHAPRPRTDTACSTRHPAAAMQGVLQHPGLAVLAAAVLCCASGAAASEPSLGDLNGHSFWKQFESGFRGLEQAALSQATRLQHALHQAMHPGKKVDGHVVKTGEAAPGDAAPAAAAAAAESSEMAPAGFAGMGGIGLMGGHLFPDIMAEEEDDEEKPGEDSSSSEEEEDAGPALAGFPGLVFPGMFENPFSVVWWKGPNVCTTREEMDETPEGVAASMKGGRDGDSSSQEDDEDDDSSGSPEDHVSGSNGGGAHPLASMMGPSMFNFHFSSCYQTQTKYECVTKSANHGVQKKLVTTRRCCHGARREPGKPGCTMVEMSSLLDTARDMGGRLFAKMLTSAGLDEAVSLAGNATLFVPTDDAMRDYIDGIQDQNRVRRALGPRPLNPVVVGDFDSQEDEAPPAPAAAPVMQAEAKPVEKSEDKPVEKAEDKPAVDFQQSEVSSENQVPDGELAAPAVPDRAGRVDVKDPLVDELVDLEDRTLVLAHRVDGIVDLHEARNDAILNTTAGTTIRLNVYAGPLGRTVTANCARVSKDRPAVGGVVHQVDAVLRPVPRERTLASLLEQDPRLSTMRALVRLSDMMEMLREASPLTLFFPTDEAFKRMDPTMRTELLKGEACVASFVRNLIVKHTVCTAAAALRLRAPNMNGEFLLLERMASDDGKLTLEDVELGPRDIVASNGVLHMLNEVIIPDSVRPVKDMLRARNMTLWLDLLEKADLLPELALTKNMTMFVPSEAALRSPEGELLFSWEDKDSLRDLLRYHIARPALEAEELTNDGLLDSALNDKPLRVNLYSTIPFLSGAVTSATVQCARIESVNSKACGAVVHEVDRVITPPTETLLDMLRQRQELSTFRDVALASSYGELLSGNLSAATHTHKLATLLAPTNAAFEENVSAERLAQIMSDKKQADAFMERHVLPVSMCCSGVGVSSWLFTNRVSSMSSHSYRIRKDSHNRVRVGDALVQQCDKMATNGIMHVIDTVSVLPLIPPTKAHSPIPVSNRRQNSNLEILLFGL
ncbi:hypothetical protein ONE63_008647 [Megalurothrips usitatus]|uniref:FAS1 domain-containing protein n=1 Tax=Megalurothrips usitatus TaxID=439358 RepID=A0AAV7XMW1_9NEOP|nr:hypothetical protein ONE63_008647 [Megalurothrips usitatus]